jgi:drug/metabolite transporter (DMT)-like permease
VQAHSGPASDRGCVSETNRSEVRKHQAWKLTKAAWDRTLLRVVRGAHTRAPLAAKRFAAAARLWSASAVFAVRHSGGIAASLLFAVLLWGGSNAGVKFLVKAWPPIWTGGTRFLCAGLLMLLVLRWTRWLGPAGTLTAEVRRGLWWRGGLSLALYIVAFNWAVRLTAVSHVALYLGASPIWALLWEGRSGQAPRQLLKRYAAAALALVGVGVLFWPALGSGHSSLPGEVLGVVCSVLWTHFGRQCRLLGQHLSGAAVTAHTMWRAGVLLLPLAVLEVLLHGVPLTPRLLGVQSYCIVAGGVVAFALWNNALRHWKTSEVYLFNNLIPLSTMLWAHFTLGEPMTPTFWAAMALVALGVVVGQTQWQRLATGRWLPAE